jgi:transcriptional regulator with XRE-family HTH domain
MSDAAYHTPGHVRPQLFALHNVAASEGFPLNDGAVLSWEFPVSDEVGPDATPIRVSEERGHRGLPPENLGRPVKGLLFPGSGFAHVPSLRYVGQECQRHVDCHDVFLAVAKYNDPKHAIGARLADARARADKTQTDVAAYLTKHGIDCDSYKTISAWENGRNNITAEALRLLCMLYKTSADVLLGTSPLSEPAAALGAMYDQIPKEHHQEAYYACKWALQKILSEPETMPLAAPKISPLRSRS